MDNHKIEVPLPEGILPNEVDLDLLKAIFQAITSLRFENFPHREALQKQIQEHGWNVKWGLTWIAEASRGHDFETATGKTTEEALYKLYHHTQMAKLGGCP